MIAVRAGGRQRSFVTFRFRRVDMPGRGVSIGDNGCGFGKVFMVRHYPLFVLAGAIPFIAGAAAVVGGLETIGPVRSVTASVLAYGLAIASFIAGTHWGIYLQFKASAPFNLFVSSNAAVLFPWLTFVTGSVDGTLVALVLTFLFLCFVDWRLRRSNLIETAYFRLRLAATAIACIALLLVLVGR